MVTKMQRGAKNTKPMIGRALYQEGNIEMTEAKKRTPVDTRPNASYPHQQAPHPGQLRASGRVDIPKVEGKEVQVVLSFGQGPSGDYAIYVHEDPDAIHPVGQWKYLESVLMESQRYMGQRLASRMDLNALVNNQ
jgi:hypothetical protein